jgi:hypothetical protein
MGNPAKAAKRSGRALATLGRNTGQRVQDVLQNFATLKADDLTNKLLAQFFDGIDASVGLIRSFAEEPPTALIDVRLPGGGGGGNTAGNVQIDLDDPVNNINNLTATQLIAPGAAAPIAMVLTDVTPAPSAVVAKVNIAVSVPNNTVPVPNMFHGFIAVGQAIQVKVYLNVHN